MEHNRTSDTTFTDTPSEHNDASSDNSFSPLIERLSGREVKNAPPSVWFMRQAGRSLPEYRKVREGISMLDACLTPDLVAEITAQPVRRHRVDAGIFFSDIVVPLRLLGIGVDIKPGVGPVLDKPVRTAADVAALPSPELIDDALAPISEAVSLSVKELGTTPLIGFCGAPFTVASYMVEGGPSKQHVRTRAMILSEPATWHRLAEWVAEVSARFLAAQVRAGARAVQVFDSWAGHLSVDNYREAVAPHTQRVFSHIAELAPELPRIHFAVGASHLLPQMLDAGASVIGVDHRIRLSQALSSLPRTVPLQGNIDPASLFASEEARFKHAAQVVADGACAPGHVVNLGHGVPPETDPQVLTDLVSFLHGIRA
ncbi:uroporphyrinogen decarboxylase [Dermabacteraceae bacterium P7054]